MSPEYNEPTPTAVIETVVEEAPTNFESPEVVESETTTVEANPTREAATHAAAMLALHQAASAGDWDQARIDMAKTEINAKI